jgi:hypothetical protein
MASGTGEYHQKTRGRKKPAPVLITGTGRTEHMVELSGVIRGGIRN